PLILVGLEHSGYAAPMNTNAALWRTGRVLGTLLSAAAFFFAPFLAYVPIRATEAAKDAKAAADSPSQAGARKPAVRIVVLKGAYADNPSAPEAELMSLLLGGLEKP